MNKIVTALVIIATAMIMTGCCSLRTPQSGPRSGKTFYHTFFGISIESAVYGDGVILN